MITERNSHLESRAARYAALADVARLQVIDALAAGDHSPSELQNITGLPSNLMAHHLKVLEDQGIVTRRRSEGDRRRTYLTLADHSVLEPGQANITAGRVLFVCSANSARSQLAAALWQRVSDVPVASAGTDPAEAIAAGARQTASRHSLALTTERPQRFANVTSDRDLVVAVCDNAYEELGDVVAVHWAVPDPVRIGTDHAFDSAFNEIRHRVTALSFRLLAS